MAEDWGSEMAALEADLASKTVDEIQQLKGMLEGELRVMTSNVNHMKLRMRKHEAMVKENDEKIKLNCQLPYLVANVAEVRAARPRVLLDAPQRRSRSRCRSSTWSPRRTPRARRRTWTCSIRARVRS